MKSSKKPKVFDFDLNYYKQNVHNLPQWFAFFCLFFVIGFAIVSRYQLLSLPNPLHIADEKDHPGEFVAERAWKDLQIFNNFGVRVTGSYNNEVLAVDFLKREISIIQQYAHVNQKIYANVQKVSGSFWAAFKPHGMTSVYRNVQNVIVKLIGESEVKENKETLMLNCHFDSVAGSPGASDDAASCAVMLEILRVLSKQEKMNKYSIIFLFNGAEETGLQASHGFITKHDWAKNIKAFLNLESVGSNGKEILFQSGPNHSWLIDMYGKSAIYPNGQVAGEELFQSGVIPSDTDFRIFRDYGNIPGMDFAHMMNGYRYHTKYDNIDYIPMPVLQRTGDNILALTKLMANSDVLSNTENFANGRKVYFDLLGLVFISYPEFYGVILNYVVAILVVILPYKFLSRTTKGVHRKRICKEIFIGLIINFIAIFVATSVTYGISSELDSNGHAMSWYHHTIFVTLLYSIPTVLVYCFIYGLFNSKKETPLSLGLKVQARLIGTNLLWGILAICITTFGYRSAYAIIVPLIIILIGNIIVGATGLQNSIKKWLYVHLIGQTFIVLFTTYSYHLVMGMFIPITGRSGADVNSEFTIGLLATMLTIMITSYLTPLIQLLNNSKTFQFTLLIIFLSARISLSLTFIGFPYRDDTNGYPTPQRIFVAHTQRTLYGENGLVRYSDSGLWIRNLDRNSHKTIESLTAPDLAIPQEKNPLCSKEIFCGLPFYTSRQVHTPGYWVSVSQPLIKDEASLKLNNISELSEFKQRMEFTINGSYLLSLQLRPRNGVKLINWDIMDTLPEPNIYLNETVYFVMITHGLTSSPFNITLDLECEEQNKKKHLIDISLVTFHWESHREHTPYFKQFLERAPKWAFIVPSVASVQSWSF